jgi:hypothetical protein
MSRLALSPYGPNRAPPDPRHLGVPSGASKLIYEPMVRLTQIVHLSCTDANTVSKQIEMSPIVCVQNDFYAYGMFGTNRAPLLH